MGSGTGVLPTGSRASSGDEQAGPFTPPTPAPVALLNIHDSAGLHMGLGESSVWDHNSVYRGSGLSGAGVKVQSSGIWAHTAGAGVRVQSVQDQDSVGLGSKFGLPGSGLRVGLGLGFSLSRIRAQ